MSTIPGLHLSHTYFQRADNAVSDRLTDVNWATTPPVFRCSSPRLALSADETKRLQETMRCRFNFSPLPFATINIISIFHVCREICAIKIDREDNLLIGLPASYPSNVEFFLANLRREISWRQHCDNLPTVINTFKYVGLPSRTYVYAFAIKEDFDLWPGLSYNNADSKTSTSGIFS
jgi:hypothetical protein